MRTLKWVRTVHPNLDVFQNFQNTAFLLLSYAACIKATTMVMEGILAFILNTKRPLSNIWLLRYKQNSFGYF